MTTFVIKAVGGVLGLTKQYVLCSEMGMGEGVVAGRTVFKK